MDSDLHRDARRSFIPKLSRASPLFLFARLTDFVSRPLASVTHHDDIPATLLAEGVNR